MVKNSEFHWGELSMLSGNVVRDYEADRSLESRQ